MTNHRWVHEFAGSVTVCDGEGIILEMNERAIQSYAAEGGQALLGSNLFECHPEPARSRLRELMAAQQVNVYTIEKRGIRKLIYQAPWYQDGQYGGFLEMVLELPEQMPHFVRQG
jgi:hypothetical protein